MRLISAGSKVQILSGPDFIIRCRESGRLARKFSDNEIKPSITDEVGRHVLRDRRSRKILLLRIQLFFGRASPILK
jgi:hypothetical protein